MLVFSIWNVLHPHSPPQPRYVVFRPQSFLQKDFVKKTVSNLDRFRFPYISVELLHLFL